jgi:uncharacterized protein (DUF302 family)
MKKSSIFLLFLFIFTGILSNASRAQDGLTIVESKYSTEETVNRLINIFNKKGLTIFKRVNHKQGAAGINMELPPTTVLIFGNPKLGTPLMQCAPTVAIDLPQKMLVWKNAGEDVSIAYNSPAYLKKRHNIEGCNKELNKISTALNNMAQKAAGND